MAELLKSVVDANTDLDKVKQGQVSRVLVDGPSR